MEPQLVLTFLKVSLASISAYITYVLLKYGIQPSISDSYYALSKKTKFLFTLALWSFAIPIVIISNNGFLFFSGSFICVVAAAQNFKDKFVGKVHYASAVIGILLGMLALVISYNMYLFPLLFVIISVILKLLKTKNLTWWVEITAITCIYLSLFKYYLTLI